MTSLIAVCGLDCARCAAYRATRANDDRLRAATAVEWSSRYGVNVTPDEVVCDGCRTGGRKLGYCANICELRKCAIRRGVETCAACTDHPCTARTPSSETLHK